MSQEGGKSDRIDPVSGVKVSEYVADGSTTSQSGGLLEKAAEKGHWTQDAIISDEGGQNETRPAAGPVEAVKSVFLFGVIPLIVFRAILVYLPFGIDELTLPGTSFSLVMAMVFLSSFAFVFWRLGLVTTTGLAVSHMFIFGSMLLETPSTTTIDLCNKISSVRVAIPNRSVTSKR